MRQEDIEKMFEKPYWIVDILPERVPADSAGQYFVIEQYYLGGTRVIELRRKQLGVLLKLNCYCSFLVSFDVGLHWAENPAPEEIEKRLMGNESAGCIHIMIRPRTAYL